MKQTILDKETDALRSFLRRLTRHNLVIVDDLGMLQLTPRDSVALYRVVNVCYKVTSLMVTSNFALALFDQTIEPTSLSAARVARLAHHAHLPETKGESIRLTQLLAGAGVKPIKQISQPEYATRELRAKPAPSRPLPCRQPVRQHTGLIILEK